MLLLMLTLSLCCQLAAIASTAPPARCTRQEATDFQAPGSKCPSKPCADLGGDGSSGHGFGAADAQACCQLCADYKGTEVCKYAVYQPGANKNLNCFLKSAPADAITGGAGNLGMELLPPSSGWGTTLLVVLLLVGAGYVGGGVMFGMRMSGKSGLMAHPHFGKWVELYGLVVDGGLVIRSASGHSGSTKRQSARDPEGGYRFITETEPLQPAQRDRKKSSAAKEKKQKAATKSGDKRNKKKRVEQSRASSATAAEAAQPSVETPSRSKVSAAGDGGRWVHVPN